MADVVHAEADGEARKAAAESEGEDFDFTIKDAPAAEQVHVRGLSGTE